jgi:ribonuclease R
MMRSRASLSYEQAQAAADGNPDATDRALVDNVIRSRFGRLCALLMARARQPLDLDLPERQIVLTPDGRVKSVEFQGTLRRP